MTQHNLGNALRELGELQGGTARLEEAIAAYRSALTERSHERVPHLWAITQHNLGAALLELGMRESGTTELKESIAAYQAALTEYTRERSPLDWAQFTKTSVLDKYYLPSEPTIYKWLRRHFLKLSLLSPRRAATVIQGLSSTARLSCLGFKRLSCD
ncbi:hypothetical protein ACE10Z_09915 [Bradyrhizobium sp. Pha-3]|uniref:hypothetical protein n=1 Tax=Bradyrhizobium sp. Pha-3 TaxID=208375 RepID=UPI0035D4F4F7